LREYASYDTTLQSEYEFIPAKVVRNSTHRSNNYLTINKGSADGIRPGMGVISPKGIVGKVEMCSEHFATISSLLHSRTWVSAAIKNTNNIGSVKWEGNSPLYAKLMHMPSHYKIQVGDTVLTSGHNAVFPPDLPIGVIHKLEVKPNETFHDVDLRLSTDFNTLTYVYVIKYLRKSEQDSLEQATVEYLDNVR
jgi:rod shape-determining protein MreC